MNERRREQLRAAQARYRVTEKGKATQHRYNVSEKNRLVQKRYRETLDGWMTRWALSKQRID